MTYTAKVASFWAAAVVAVAAEGLYAQFLGALRMAVGNLSASKDHRCDVNETIKATAYVN
jgi:hypothetical protein